MADQEKDRMADASPEAEKVAENDPDVEEAAAEFATDESAQETPAGDAASGGADTTDNSQKAGSEETDPQTEQETPAEKLTWAQKQAARKQAKQEKKADPNKEKVAELEDKVKRQLAEFENFRRRTEKEKQAMFETGAKSVIEKMLPVIDNFERGLATVPEEKKDDPFVDGMSRVYRQLLTELEAIDVKPIEAVGKEFDPALHNAVMQVSSDTYEAGIVAQELQKGYTYRDSVVRHSMVAVVSE